MWTGVFDACPSEKTKKEDAPLKVKYIAIALLLMSLLLCGCAPDDEKNEEMASSSSASQNAEAGSSQTTQASGKFEVFEGVGTLPSISFDDFE